MDTSADLADSTLRLNRAFQGEIYFPVLFLALWIAIASLDRPYKTLRLTTEKAFLLFS